MISGQKLLKAKSSVQTAHVYTIILITGGGKTVMHCFFPHFFGSVAVTVHTRRVLNITANISLVTPSVSSHFGAFYLTLLSSILLVN